MKSDKFEFEGAGILTGNELPTIDYNEVSGSFYIHYHSFIRKTRVDGEQCALQIDGPAFDIDFLDLSEWTLDSVWPFDALDL